MPQRLLCKLFCVKSGGVRRNIVEPVEVIAIDCRTIILQKNLVSTLWEVKTITGQ